MGSKVYYTDMRARPGRSLLDKLRSLMKAVMDCSPKNGQ